MTKRLPRYGSLCAVILAAVLLLIPAPSIRASAGDLVISEFMAINGSVLMDEDGDYSDWIEILNVSAFPVDLGGVVSDG